MKPSLINIPPVFVLFNLYHWWFRELPALHLKCSKILLQKENPYFIQVYFLYNSEIKNVNLAFVRITWFCWIVVWVTPNEHLVSIFSKFQLSKSASISLCGTLGTQSYCIVYKNSYRLRFKVKIDKKVHISLCKTWQ